MLIWARIAQLLEKNEPCVLVSIYRADGSTPRDVGARMIVSMSGIVGSIGGGALELAAIEQAQSAMIEDTDAYWFSDFPLGPELAQCCGGFVGLLFEPFFPARLSEIVPLAAQEKVNPFNTKSERSKKRITRKILNNEEAPDQQSTLPLIREQSRFIEQFGIHFTPVYIFGAGHVAKALLLALAPLPFKTFLIDQRREAFPKKIPESAYCVLADNPVDEISKAESGAFILVMTHDHSLDLALVHAALGRSDFPYVGLIGSKTKKQRFINRLQESGIDENGRARLICPVGITGIESKHPAQIATAIAAQLLMERQTNDL